MAFTLFHLSSSLLLLLLLFLPSSAAAIVPLVGNRPAMVLPLFHSSLNSSAISNRRLRRSVAERSSPNAHMRLYDDLLLNGYYTTQIWIGTPPQRFALIVDTGSTVTYVPCSTCEQCGNHQDPKFQPDLSSTYQPVKCSADCNCDNERNQCVYERQYAEMSSSSGVLGNDLISFGNESELQPQRAVFGCENEETGDIYSQHADGIMGLGRGELSIVDQLVDRGVINDSFSLCYGGMDIGGGAMVLGAISPPSNMVFAQSDPVRSSYYNIDLKEIHIARKPLPINPKVFDVRHGTILDSGTTYAYFPEAAFVAIKDAIMKELSSLRQVRGPDPNYNDICFSGGGSDIFQLSNTFPAVDLVFENGQKLSLSPENYLFKHSRQPGAYCLGMFQNGKDPTTLLGGIIVRNTLVTYDRENDRIGFWRTNCSELWERINLLGAPAPAPSSIDVRNSTSEKPNLAPVNQPSYAVPEGVQIEQITFQMALNVSYSDMKLHIPQFTESIASEFGVGSSQIHFLNLVSKGNGSLIEWTVVHSASENYIYHGAALDLISKVAEHHLQLPERFGIYQLIGFKIQLVKDRKWWLRQRSLVVTIIIVALVLGLLASLTWFIWRRRQESLTAYKLVSEAVPEVELQSQPV